MSNFRTDFIRFALEKQALCFGQYTTKAGRHSPYFFNAGLFNDGSSILKLARFYAQSIREKKIQFDMLFGPAYKGIILAATTSIALAEYGNSIVPFAYNRKEKKSHGEGGQVVGAPLSGRVLIIDDVISAGTSVRESIAIIEAHGATPAGVAVSLDRMEKGQTTLSAVQEVEQQYGLPVTAIATLQDILGFLQDSPELAKHFSAVQAYRAQYGIL